MRSSSISSQGYSYAKTNTSRSQNSAPHHLPPSVTANITSTHHYSHLRSKSGPPIAPQFQPLSAQIEQQPSLRQFPLANSQPPVATTRLDDDSGSIVVVQRQASAPVMATSNRGQRGVASEEAQGKEIESPDDLALVLDDLAKITQELDENMFLQGAHTVQYIRLRVVDFNMSIISVRIFFSFFFLTSVLSNVRAIIGKL